MLTQINNAVLRIGYFSVQWKIAKIFLIHKPGKPTNDIIKSYTPISLPDMSKVAEEIINDRITC